MQVKPRSKQGPAHSQRVRKVILLSNRTLRQTPSTVRHGQLVGSVSLFPTNKIEIPRYINVIHILLV